MGKNRIEITDKFRLGEISPYLWGSFIEHMGRAVYGGIYQPDHPTADGQGFRGDVKRLIEELRVPLIRYPGGNFLSGYDWRDGIGKDRPRRLDLAWGQTEPNAVGIHEFCGYAESVGAEVMMSVNMGTGTPKEAAALVEYCNHPSGSAMSDWRIRNGSKKPFGIKKWCIGNEMDGDWQICALTADEYGRKAAETAKLMRWVDPNVELVVCGSSDPTMAGYPAWDRTVLEHTYPYVDYISLHRYYSYPPSLSTADFLASHLDLEAFIHTVACTTEYVRAVKRGKKKIKLSLDEWNIWHRTAVKEGMLVNNGVEGDRWSVGPHRIENVYDYTDALAFAGLLISIIRHCDDVKIGCMAQLVNVIAPILTDNDGGAIRQSIFFPYKTALDFARGTALQTAVACDGEDTAYGYSEHIHTAAVACGDELRVFLLNKSEQTLSVDVVTDFAVTPDRTVALYGESADARNTFERPDTVGLRQHKLTGETGFTHTVKLAPRSYGVAIWKR